MRSAPAARTWRMTDTCRLLMYSTAMADELPRNGDPDRQRRIAASGPSHSMRPRNSLTKAGIELVEAIPVDQPARLKSEVRSAVDRAPMVIVGGGDGTLSSAVDYFVGT